MSQLWSLETTKEMVKDLKEKEAVSTKVVGWYGHFDTVRGPYHRWLKMPVFKATEVGKKYPVASPSDDCAFAAAAMSAAPNLVEAYEKMSGKLKRVVEVFDGADLHPNSSQAQALKHAKDFLIKVGELEG